MFHANVNNNVADRNICCISQLLVGERTGIKVTAGMRRRRGERNRGV